VKKWRWGKFKQMNRFLFIPLVLFLLSCENEKNKDCTDRGITQTEDCTITDLDGNIYQNVQIGSQLWMAENLKVTHYRNGDEIPTGYSSFEWSELNETETGAYAVYDDDEGSADTYGYLYNWYAVDDDRGICPEGWNVPTDDEVKELEMYLGMNEEEASSTGWRGTNEGSKLVGETDLWPDGNLINNLGYDEESGFDFLPSGYRYYNNGNFDHVGISGFFWSSTEYNNDNAWYRLLVYSNSGIGRGFEDNKRNGFSIRCVKR